MNKKTNIILILLFITIKASDYRSSDRISLRSSSSVNTNVLEAESDEWGIIKVYL